MKNLEDVSAGRAGELVEARNVAPDSSSPVRSIAAVAYGVALVAVFGLPLYYLFTYALGTTLHSHVVLIPLITLYLINIERPSLPRAGKPALFPASVLLGIGALAFYAGYTVWGRALSQNDQLALVAFSFLCFVWAGGFLLLGGSWMKASAFPMAFLLFMVPLPDGVAEWLETASKYASADATALLFGLFGVPNFRDGLIFRLPGIAIEVAQECSGIRSSWVLLITSLLASYLFLRSSWRRAILVAFVIPLGVIRNGFRIMVIGWLCVNYGPHMINSIVHRRGGPFFFVLSLIPLFALLWWLRRSENQKRAARADALATANRARP